VEGGRGDGDVDVFGVAVAAQGEERHAADEDETVLKVLREEGHCRVERFEGGCLLAGADYRHFEFGYEEF
jgi:hypothetical protein